MKKILLFLLGVIVGVGACVGVYCLASGDTDWQAYMEEKIVPTVVSIITSIGLICLAALPVVKSVTTAAGLFSAATKDVTATAEEGRTASVQISEYVRQTQEMSAYIGEMKEKFDAGIKQMQAQMCDVKQICKMGFCNSEELVRKGYATEIAKVGETNETQ